MARYYGKIRYFQTVETAPGVWEEQYNDRAYYGDIIRNNRRITVNDNINSKLDVSVNISILADPFAYQNFQYICAAEYAGQMWKVSSVDVDKPRLTLSLGGLFNEIENTTSRDI